jgi:cytochrome c oxidase assembly protein subunit 15
LQIIVPDQHKIYDGSSKNLLIVILSLFVVQLIYGAFMAGLKAATSAPTWPTINGEFIPSNVAHFQGNSYSFSSSLINNPITVQFIHRNLGYLIFVLLITWTAKAIKEKKNTLFNTVKWLPLLFVLCQVILGIAALLTSPLKQPQKWGVFEWNAQLHQFMAMLLLLSLVLVFFLFQGKQKANSRTTLEPQVI